MSAHDIPTGQNSKHCWWFSTQICHRHDSIHKQVAADPVCRSVAATFEPTNLCSQFEYFNSKYQLQESPVLPTYSTCFCIEKKCLKVSDTTAPFWSIYATKRAFCFPIPLYKQHCWWTNQNHLPTKFQKSNRSLNQREEFLFGFVQSNPTIFAFIFLYMCWIIPYQNAL